MKYDVVGVQILLKTHTHKKKKENWQILCIETGGLPYSYTLQVLEDVSLNIAFIEVQYLSEAWHNIV